MAKRPNILLIMTDQLRAFELGCYGNGRVKTPSIDRLAAAGMQFEIAVSNNPVCTPARSCALSGQYSRTCTGYLGNETDEAPGRARPRFPNATLPEVVHNAGYRTALVGKWHVGAHPSLLGFEDFVFPKLHHLNKNQIYLDPSGAAQTVMGYAEEFNLRMLDERLRRFRDDDGRPFFIYYNIATPHMPYFDVPEKYKTMYHRDGIALRDNVWLDGKLAYDERWFRIYLWDYLFYQGFFGQEYLAPQVDLPGGFDLKALTALYYGMVSYTDEYVGKAMALLERHGLVDDTLVILTSDHGDNLGSHHLFNKDHLFEESIRIPMIYHWPVYIRPQRNTAQVTSLVDIMPTVLELCDLPVPGHVQGNSVYDVVRGTRSTVDSNAAFVETSRGEVGIRTLTHLYGIQLGKDLAQVADERRCFYDIEQDPYEMDNLKEEMNSPVARQLRRRVLHWHENTPWMK